jgi:hypothetical protein
MLFAIVGDSLGGVAVVGTYRNYYRHSTGFRPCYRHFSRDFARPRMTLQTPTGVLK